MEKSLQQLIDDIKAKEMSAPNPETIRALVRSGRPAFDLLLPIFYGENTFLRSKVAKVFATMGALVFDEMLAALGHANYHVRLHAADVLGKLGDSRAVEPLIAQLEREVANPIVPPSPKDRAWTLEEILEFYDEAGSERKKTEDDKGSVRAFIAIALGNLRDPRGVDALIGHLEDPDGHVCWQSALALGKIGDLRALEPLVACLSNKYAQTSAGAAKGLAFLDDPRAIRPLIEIALHNPSENRDLSVRESAADALVKFGQIAVEPLITALHDSDAGTRVWAACALGKIHDPRPLQELERLKTDHRTVDKELGTLRVSEEAERAIERIRLLDASTDTLLISVRDVNPIRRVVSVEYLAEKPDSRATQALVLLLNDPIEEVRNRSIILLGKIGDAQVIRELERFSEQKKGIDHILAQQSIRQIRQRGAQQSANPS